MKTSFNLREAIGTWFRTKRRNVFTGMFQITDKVTIVDVGGYNAQGDGFSCAAPTLRGLNAKITTVNLSGPVDVIADARSLPFPSKSFDIAFSNSMIEHVGTEEDQYECAKEIRRVGLSYYVQTPNRWFPFEVHWAIPLPLLHWLPRRWFDPSPRSTRNPQDPPLRLLSARELKRMFPEAKIERERFLGFTKSITAVFVKTPHTQS